MSPMNLSDYPPDWPAISLRIREREGWKCKWCGAENGARSQRGSRVVLTVAHLGTPHADGRPGDKHDKMDVRDENLAALCQACHLGYDLADHVRHRKYGRGKGQLPLLVAALVLVTSCAPTLRPATPDEQARVSALVQVRADQAMAAASAHGWHVVSLVEFARVVVWARDASEYPYVETRYIGQAFSDPATVPFAVLDGAGDDSGTMRDFVMCDMTALDPDSSRLVAVKYDHRTNTVTSRSVRLVRW